MTLEQLQALGIDAKWQKPLEDVFAKYDINTVKRQAAFIGQCGHQSNNFKILEENLNYSAQGLRLTFNKATLVTKIVREYGRTAEHPANQEAIANTVYGGDWS